MPDEPNKKMDEMLRAYAQERRKGSDVTLHPATRNLLQAEVKTVFGAQPALPWWRKLRAFWPHFAFAGGLCLVFGITVLSLRQPSRSLQEGRSSADAATRTAGEEVSVTDLSQEPKKPETPAPAQNGGTLATDAIVPVRQAPPEEVSQSRGEKTAVEQKLNERLQNARPRTVQQKSMAPPREEKRKAEQETLLLKSEPAPIDAAAAANIEAPETAAHSRAKVGTPAAIFPESTPAPAGSALQSGRDDQTASAGQLSARGLGVAEPLARAEELDNLAAGRRINFVQFSNTPVVAGAPLAAVPPTVLGSFQMEQSGTNLRVLDRDGSIYLGALRATNSATMAGLKDDRAQTENSLAYFFTVQGTNRTLNADVVLTGNYFEQTNPEPTSLHLFADAPGTPTLQENQVRQQGQTRRYIIGNATVGSTNQVPVRAVSTSP